MLKIVKVLTIVIGVYCIAGLVPVARSVVVPSFKAVKGDYTYQWHRVANEAEQKSLQVKYQGRDYCEACHPENYQKIKASKHAMVQCENCHGPAIEHPESPQKLVIDQRRESCLRCHSYLPYRPKQYAGLSTGAIPMKMQDPEQHNPGIECTVCHDVHSAGFK